MFIMERHGGQKYLEKNVANFFVRPRYLLVPEMLFEN